MWKGLQGYIDRLTGGTGSGSKQKGGKMCLSKQEREFLPGVLETMERPAAPGARRLLWVLAGILLAVALWTCLGHVDEVAVAEGKVIPNGESKVVQAEDKGIIKAICVQEGQLVHQGDLLVELDATVTQADLDSLKQKIGYYQVDIDRLLAEENGSEFAIAEESLLDKQDRQFQINLYRSRMEAYQSKLATASYNLSQQEANLAAEKAGYDKLSQLYDIAQEKSQRVVRLADENAISTFTVLEYESKAVELQKDVKGQECKIEQAAWGVIQARQEMAQIQAEHNNEIAAQLVESRRQLAAAQEELKKAQEKNRLAQLRAPIDGRVAHLAVHTVGGVVTPAQAIMEVVPEQAVPEIEAWVQNKDIGFVQKGQETEVKIEAFSFQKYGTLTGHVVQISPDALEDREKGRRYRVIIALDKPEFQLLDRTADVAAGMTASAEIKIRQKRIIEFFLDPFRQYTSEALRER